MAPNIEIVVNDPGLTRRQVSSVRPPVTPIVAHHGKEGVRHAIQNQNARVCYARINRGDVKGQNLGKAGQKELLGTSLLRALLTPPIRNLKGAGGLDNRIRN